MAPEKAPQKFSRSWDALTPPLADFILEAVASMGFNELTPVQAATLPLFRGNKDVVVEVSLMCQEPKQHYNNFACNITNKNKSHQAVTGSGKTLAYLSEWLLAWTTHEPSSAG